MDEAVRWIDPQAVRFTQESISYTFKEGGTIDDLASGLRTGVVLAAGVEPIRLVEREGRLYTLDNRRLEAFRRAGAAVPYRMATAREIRREWARKFTTTSDGVAVTVRGGSR